MKKLTLSLAASILLVFSVGCSTENQEEANNENDDVSNNEEQTNSENNEVNEGTSNEEEVLEEDPVVEEEDSDAQDDITEDSEGQEEADEIQEPQYQMDGSTVKAIEEGTNENVVMLTIDDVFLSTNNNYALEMAEILDDLGAKAIFFVNGQLLNDEENKEKLKQMHELGFEIGNHSMTHPNFSNISPEEQRAQIVELNNIVEEVTGERPRFLRAPFGVNTDTSKAVAEEEGMQWMNWSYGFDFVQGYMEAEALTQIMLDPGKDGEPVSLRNGSNLLMHDREFTRDALKGIVEGLREKGFEIVDPALIK